MIPYFSIIIPVYNAEDFLTRCVNSIIVQTFQDYELILINDGSDDKSEFLCKKFAQSYSNVKYITQKNQGQSVARNTGISVAKGKYVMFIDNDDTLPEKTVLDTFYNHVEGKNYDIVVASIVSNVNQTPKVSFKITDVLNGQDAFIKMRILKSYYGNIYGKIYSLNFIKRNRIYFYKDLINEDELWTPIAFYFAQKVSFINVPTYKRYFHSNQQTALSNHKTIYRKAIGRLIVAKELILFTEKNNDSMLYTFKNELLLIAKGFFYQALFFTTRIKKDKELKQIQIEGNYIISKLKISKIAKCDAKFVFVQIFGIRNVILLYKLKNNTISFFLKVSVGPTIVSNINQKISN